MNNNFIHATLFKETGRQIKGAKKRVGKTILKTAPVVGQMLQHENELTNSSITLKITEVNHISKSTEDGSVFHRLEITGKAWSGE